MTRGNQRDLAREKNQKKGAGSKSSAEHGANQGMSLQDRKQRDAERMQQKQKAALEKKEKDGN